MQVRRTILFNSNRDKDILEWLDAQDNASQAVRDALHLAMGEQKQKITLEDIYKELQEIKRQGITVKSKNESEIDEPSDIVANLNELGL